MPQWQAAVPRYSRSDGEVENSFVHPSSRPGPGLYADPTYCIESCVAAGIAVISGLANNGWQTDARTTNQRVFRRRRPQRVRNRVVERRPLRIFWNAGFRGGDMPAFSPAALVTRTAASLPDGTHPPADPGGDRGRDHL